MRSEPDAMVANLREPARSRVIAAFSADRELADGVAGVIADMPRCVQEEVLQRLGVRLQQAPLGGGAFVAALTDVV